MKFATAMLAMADGKKVRRACWKKGSYWARVCGGSESAIDSKGNLIDDWEMFEPKGNYVFQWTEENLIDDWKMFEPKGTYVFQWTEEKLRDLPGSEDIKDSISNFIGIHNPTVTLKEVHDFEWALKQLKAGKAVRRSSWGNKSYHYCMDVNSILIWSDDLRETDYVEINGEDWEVYSPVSTLSSKISVGLIKVTDIKEHLNMYLAWLKESSMQNPRELFRKAKELFGDELVD